MALPRVSLSTAEGALGRHVKQLHADLALFESYPLCHFLQQRLGLFQVSPVEALSKPAVDRREEVITAIPDPDDLVALELTVSLAVIARRLALAFSASGKSHIPSEVNLVRRYSV